MPFPQGAFPESRANRTRPAQPRDGGHILAVGQRAFASDPHGRKGLVVLNDASGKIALGHLADGTEIEILAWIPRGRATLYRVQATELRIEGWLHVANLRTSPSQESPAVPVPATTPVAWISPVRRSARDLRPGAEDSSKRQ